MTHDPAQPASIRIARPADVGELQRRDVAEQLADVQLAMNNQVGPGPTFAWLWVWRVAAKSVTGVATITAEQLAAGISPPGRNLSTESARLHLTKAIDAGLVTGQAIEGRRGGWHLRPLAPAAVERLLAGALEAVAGDPQALLPIDDENSKSNGDSLWSFVGGKGGGTSSTSLLSAALNRSSTSDVDVRRLTSDDHARAEEMYGAPPRDGDVSSDDATWLAACERAERLFVNVPRLVPQKNDDADVFAKAC